MASENTVLVTTMDASGNGLSAATDQFIFVVASDTPQKVVPAGAGANALGVTQDTAKDGRGISIAVGGFTKMRLGGTVSFGDFLQPDASGNAVLIPPGTGPASARAMDDGVSGDVIQALIVHTFAAT